MRFRLILSAILCAGAITISACTPKAQDATPEGAVRLYLDRMDATTEGSATMREVYTLLGPVTRNNLEGRASRAGRIQGRRIEPFEMLAAGRFALKFRPKAMSSRSNGAGAPSAVVDVVGYDAHEVAQVNVVREGAAYKVELDLPDVAPLPQRTLGGGTNSNNANNTGVAN